MDTTPAVSCICDYHSCQGLTLNQAVVDLGTREQSAGLSFVAILRVRQLVDLVLQPFVFDRISRLGVAPSVVALKLEEIHLGSLAPRVAP